MSSSKRGTLIVPQHHPRKAIDLYQPDEIVWIASFNPYKAVSNRGHIVLFSTPRDRDIFVSAQHKKRQIMLDNPRCV